MGTEYKRLPVQPLQLTAVSNFKTKRKFARYDKFMHNLRSLDMMNGGGARKVLAKMTLFEH